MTNESDNQKIKPLKGEHFKYLPNGNVLMTISGKTIEISAEDLGELDSDESEYLKGLMSPITIIDNFIANTGERELLQKSEVVDFLLDVRNTMSLIREALNTLMDFWVHDHKLIAYYEETFGPIELPKNYQMGLDDE